MYDFNITEHARTALPPDAATHVLTSFGYSIIDY